MADPFEQLAAQVDKIVDSRPLIAERAATALLDLAKGQWSSGTAPSGRAWKPTKTGAVALTAVTSGATSRAEGSAVVIELDDRALPHMTGRGHAPRRQTLPYADAALPPKYADALERAATEVLEELAR